MTFPIAVGTGPRHSSSRPFPNVSRWRNCENGEQGGDREASDDVRMATGTNDDGTLTATLFISYHFLPITNGASNADGSNDVGGSGRVDYDGESDATNGFSTDDTGDSVEFNVVAELRVQITPTTSPFASDSDATSSRETKSRVPLGIMRKRRRQNCSAYAANASIEFSPNEAHLACLIPLPTSYEVMSSSGQNELPDGVLEPSSTIVIFRVQAHKVSSYEQSQRAKQHNLPRLPDYIVEKTTDGERPKVDTEIESNQASEINDHSGENEQEEPEDSANTSVNRTIMSYVAHQPKIVRAPIPSDEAPSSSTNDEDVVPNTSFLRKLSGGATKHVSHPVRDRTLQSATCMCNIPFDHHRGKTSSAVSMLLVGTTDGNVLLVDFSTARVQSAALESHAKQTSFSGEQNCPNRHIAANGTGPEQLHSLLVNPIVHLSQCTPSLWKPLDVYGEEQGSESKGRIATVLRDGSVNIYTTAFVPSGAKYGGLQMTIEPLSTWSADASRLRYMCAKWMNPLVLVLLTRSQLLDEDFLQLSGPCLAALPSEVVMAQGWTIAEVVGHKETTKLVDKAAYGWKVPSNVGASIALVSELKVPCGDGLEELVHDTFSLSSMRPGSDSSRPGNSVFAECARGMSVMHHRATDCLAINTQQITRTAASNAGYLNVRPFCLIWDWKRNVPALTLASSETYSLRRGADAEANNVQPLFSRLQLGEDDDLGMWALHVYEQTSFAGRRRAVKDVFSLSALSPTNVEGGLCLSEPSPILLHRDSVTFPLLRRPSNSCDASLQWEEARMPPAYTASNGPCRIAAVGKECGRSIAVAASRGLCVLDLTRMPRLESQRPRHEKKTPCTTGQPDSALVTSPATSLHPRWKQFSNINDEQRFRVVSMLWWELGDEDLLLATVQYQDSDSLHLVCWSRKSLGFGDKQLLTDSSSYFTGEEDDATSQYGSVLPSGFHAVQSMSIIADPADRLTSSNSSAPSNRALLLLAYVSCHEGSSQMNYAVYQLQAIPSSNGMHELVLAKNSACGRIPLQLGRSSDFSAPESVTGVFLAGGSFVFNLQTETNEEDAFAVIGILTVFQGLVAVCVTQAGPALYRPSLLENAYCQDRTKGLVVSHWMSGTCSSRTDCRVAWNIALNDDNVFCWSVPCRNAESNHQPSTIPNNPGDNGSALLSLGLERHSVLGDICHLGSSSLWRNGGRTSEREIALGPFCPLLFGCTLYAGQRSRKKGFHVSNLTVAPPQFTPFLFVSLLSLASASIGHESEWQLVDGSGEGSSMGLGNRSHHERDRIKSVLISAKGLGSSASALRVITLKVVELLNESKAAGDMKMNQDNLSKESNHLMRKWTVGKAILQEVVSVAREIYDALGFATFFLSVGRQLEPHQFDLIFPLPSVESPSKSLPLSTSEDLFSAACQGGSLATALSALPLFSDHRVSQQSVTRLVYHCLLKIEENLKSFSSHTALTSGEDETFLHQLFWFGVKLEDAIEVEGSFDTEYESASGSESEENLSQSLVSSSTASFEESSIDEDDDGFVSVSSSVEADYSLDTYSSEENEVSFLTPCRTPRKKPRVGIVKKVVRKLFQTEEPPVNPLEENAINEAASSFILSGFDGLSIESPKSTPLTQTREDSASENGLNGNKSTEDELIASYADSSSVAGAVCIFMQHAIVFGGHPQSNYTRNFGWKAVSAVAHLLQGERETTAIASAGSANARSISRLVTMDDFLAAATTSQLAEMSGEEGKCKTIAPMIRKLMSGCSHQLHSEAFGSVFNLILLLLLRYETCSDVQQCKATLIAVGISAGHLSGRVEELLDFKASCDANAIYSALFAADIDS